MNLGTYITRSSTFWPEREALICGERRLTYGELERITNRLASALIGRGLAPGQAVATYAGNCAQAVETEMALSKSGLVRVPISPRLSVDEVAHILDDADVRVLFVDGERVEEGGEGSVAVEADQHDAAVLNFTSGSTGKLKAAVQTHGNRLANMRKLDDEFGLLARDPRVLPRRRAHHARARHAAARPAGLGRHRRRPAALGRRVVPRRALALTVDFARTRQVFGAPIGALQSVQHKLADMATSYYAARSMTYDALADLDADREPRTEAFMCKLFVAENAFRIADEAVQIHGKAGLVRGAEVEAVFRKLRMFRVLTGSSEIQKNGIARQLLLPG
ncbi:AMP-binding protein [Streptomyces sp. NPDC051684]|uniref:AMP-binding protein n=1 Tax=Streptomyces sp. NPDC051684 TaxID=3365670 RepID=UPI0037B6CC33